MEKQKEKISSSLNRLRAIVEWFEGQEEVDIEEGLRKVKEGSSLIKDLRTKLKKVENEFEEIRKELETEEE